MVMELWVGKVGWSMKGAICYMGWGVWGWWVWEYSIASQLLLTFVVVCFCTKEVIQG